MVLLPGVMKVIWNNVYKVVTRSLVLGKQYVLVAATTISTTTTTTTIFIIGEKISSVLTSLAVITTKRWYKMIKAYCSNGHRSEDGRLGLENSLKIATDKVYLFFSWY